MAAEPLRGYAQTDAGERDQVVTHVRRLLVANRGEIAVRIFRTCARLGIETVAVATPDDGGSLHARTADATVEIASYLDPGAIVAAAEAAGADAVHPGYGFLSESDELAAAVAAAGLIWIGPSAEALRLGGDKLEAKRIARTHGIPTLHEGTPEEIGFPLLVKAVAGGGGRGMRIVRDPAELEEALAAASREAEAAFGDGTVFCERYLERPRHVEVQLLADAHGTVLALGDRDCSVQRRHQKLLEESPAPGLSPELRARLHHAAATFGRAIGYSSAGTAEFLVEGDELFFLELNGRIQVEHPVTEEVTGIDLVEQQLRIAAGETIAGLSPGPRGHAVEARLYAEDPRTFLPQAGTIARLRLPGGIRVDEGVAEGDTIGTSYDPLIAKLIAHGPTRDAALDRLAQALAETEVAGVVTNLPFLRWLVAHPTFRAGQVSTAFLLDHPPLSAPPLRPPPEPFRASWRLNLPPPARAAAPDVDAGAAALGAAAGEGRLFASLPATVVKVVAGAGDTVPAHAPVIILEAMKMEVPITAPFAGTVKAVHVAPGDTVARGALLAELETEHA
jgi:acetyl/propionyl-CoA carboxylase alpha subunit